MTQSDLHLEQSETDVNEQKGVSRRRLLKLLGASGLAVGAAALLPAKWISPQAEVSAQANNGPWPGGCTVEDFPLTIGGSTVSLVNAATGVWKVDFQYFDSAGLLSNSSLLTAGVVNTREPLYRKAQLGTSPNGGVFLLSNASYSPACNTSATVGQTGGEGYFHFSYNSSTRMAANVPLAVQYYLAEPGERTSNSEIVLFEPVAVSLADFVADEGAKQTVVTAAAVAGAAGLAAATVKAVQGRSAAKDE